MTRAPGQTSSEHQTLETLGGFPQYVGAMIFKIKYEEEGDDFNQTYSDWQNRNNSNFNASVF